VNALVVDDERLARAELRRLLAKHSEVRIVGEAADVEDARRAIARHDPELVFLDVQMPGGSGFDLLASLEHAPYVIFTTAYDEYALRAFEVNALDYLTKPIQAARLAAALARAGERLSRATAPLAAERKIFIKDGERCWFVALAEIALFESEGNYTRVYFSTEQPLAFRSLNQLEARLDRARFFRASRRHIVNLEMVASVTPSLSGGLTLTLANGLAVEMSRRRAAELKQFLSV